MESSPSFNTHSCINNIADIANRVVQEQLQVDKGFNDLISFSDDDIKEDDEANTQEDEFEFPLIFPDSSLIIDNHQISPRYPLFDRSLLLNLDTNLISNLDSKPAPAPAPAPTPTVTPVTTSSSAPVSAPTPALAPTVTPVATSASAAVEPETRLSLGKLLSEDHDSTQSSTLVFESNDLNTISPETYCIWKPQEQEHRPQKQHHSRGKHKKSNSISISDDTPSKRWKVRDLLKRSYSDDSKHTSCVAIYSPPSKQKTGKDGSVVVVLPPTSPKPNNEKVKKPEKCLKTTASMGGGCGGGIAGCTTSHKPENKTPAYKAKIGNIRLPAFLPYRQDQHQLDAFANNYKWVK